MNRSAARWAAPVAWMALVLVLSLLPLRGTGLMPRFPHYDKVAHFMMYFVLALLMHRAARQPCLKCAVWITAACGAAGGSVELFQALVPGRGPSALDALANIAGAAFASYVYVLYHRRGPGLRTRS